MARGKIQEQVDKIKSGVPIKDDDRVDFISTNSTMLNLALSGKGLKGGIPRGRITNIVGDGSTGKTWLALEIAAWAFYNITKVNSNIFPPIKKLIIVYNNVEDVMDFPVAKIFKEKFVSSVEWIKTGTIEAFGRDYARRVMDLKEGEFLLYILDSFDALTSEKGKERFEEAAEKDKEEKGSYGTEKAKYGSSSFFSNICDISSGKDATLVVISQVRQNIDSVMFGEKYYRTGGKALDFYTHSVPWLAVVEKLKKTFHGEERIYGIRVRAKVKRSKVSKPFREAETIILFDYGIDNISSMISFLWGPKVEKIDFDNNIFSRNDFIKYIEDNKLEDVLSEMCEKEWQVIEDAVAPKDRKGRFE